MNVYMFHFGRCGSTALASVINRIPGFYWHGEIFSQGVYVFDEFNKLKISEKQGAGIFSRSDFVEYLRAARNGIRNESGNPLLRYGCEIKSYHFEWNYFKFTLEDSLSSILSEFTNARLIFLHRRNSFRRILSATLARKSGIYHISSPAGSPSKIIVDTERLEDADLNFCGDIVSVLRNSAEAENRYSNLIRRFGGFLVCYEDHIEHGMEKGIELINSQLGTEIITAETHLKKTNPFPLSEIIVNFDTVSKKLYGSGFEWMLD